MPRCRLIVAITRIELLALRVLSERSATCGSRAQAMLEAGLASARSTSPRCSCLHSRTLHRVREALVGTVADARVTCPLELVRSLLSTEGDYALCWNELTRLCPSSWSRTHERPTVATARWGIRLVGAVGFSFCDQIETEISIEALEHLMASRLTSRSSGRVQRQRPASPGRQLWRAAQLQIR